MKTLLMALCLFCLPLAAESSNIYIDNANNLAAEGYDVVTYFTNGNPELGTNMHEADWQGVKWRFVSAENLRKFETQPEKYAPKYGGYCAWALVEGRLVGGLPNLWTISEGKLYFFCSHEALQKWQEGGNEAIKKANDHWQSILQKNG